MISASSRYTRTASAAGLRWKSSAYRESRSVNNILWRSSASSSSPPSSPAAPTSVPNRSKSTAAASAATPATPTPSAGELFGGVMKNTNGSTTTSNTEINSSSRRPVVGASASVQRTFGPNSNADVMLTCGGPGLAKHASFDPEYSRARAYLRQHPIGPAVLSPVLLQGLVGALVEAAFPQAVPVTQALRTHQPLIVGVDVQANITVTEVQDDNNQDVDLPTATLASKGYHVQLQTEVVRTRDGVVIAEGNQRIWIPDYLQM